MCSRLSEENAETRKQIDDKTEERKGVVADGKQAAEDRDKKSSELKPLRDTFETTCWDETEDIRKSFDQTQGGKKKKLQFADEVLSGKHSAVEHKRKISRNYTISPMIQRHGGTHCSKSLASWKVNMIFPVQAILAKK